MELLTKDNEQVKALTSVLDKLLSKVKGVLQQPYKPSLYGERYFTDSELSERLKISRRTLQDYRTSGKLPYIHLGGKVLYKESDVLRVLKDGYHKMDEL